MTIDAIQSGLSSLRDTLDQMQKNAQEIAASATLSDQTNVDKESPSTSVVLSLSEPNASREESNGSEQLTGAILENRILEHQAVATIKTIKVADELTGTAINIGNNVDTRA